MTPTTAQPVTSTAPALTMRRMGTTKLNLVAVYFTDEELAKLDKEREAIRMQRLKEDLQRDPDATLKPFSRSNFIRSWRALPEMQSGGAREGAGRKPAKARRKSTKKR